MSKADVRSRKRVVWGAPDDALKDRGIMAYTSEKRAEILRLLKRSDLTAEEISHMTGISGSVVEQVLTSESRHPGMPSV